MKLSEFFLHSLKCLLILLLPVKPDNANESNWIEDSSSYNETGNLNGNISFGDTDGISAGKKSDETVPIQFSEQVEIILRKEIEEVKEDAMDTLLKIFGLSSIPLDERPLGSPPEFMIDLYNTITDSYGVTRARNPYNAHVVRSYMEKNNSIADYLYFNVSSASLSPFETVLEAELHVYRQPTDHGSLHPSLYLTPFYILSLYEVVDMNQLRIPDLHKLLGVNYVPALGSGWEIFNVKQPVTQWIQGDRKNLGFLLAATSLGGDRVPVRFSRRGDSADSKQPNLVLFTEDSSREPILPYKEKKVTKVLDRQDASTGSDMAPKNETENSETHDDENNESNSIPESSLENPRFHHALLYKDSIRHPNSINRFRSRRSKNQTETAELLSGRNQTSCGRRDLIVNFEAIGWSSWIVSPKGYNAFFCDGHCRFPLGQQVKPTNHATIQSIVHELKLSRVQRPCCVPTKLLPISLLYYDDHDNVVLRQYVDMVAESCGCH